MASKLRIVTRRFLFFANITVVVFFLLSCLAPFSNPHTWWVITFLGLAFPFLLILVLLFMIGWLIMLKPKAALLSFFALLLGFQSIGIFFAFHIPGSFSYKREPGTIRIVDWNVARFIEMKRNNNRGSQVRTKMIELLREQNADILCLQEFFHSFDSTYYPNVDVIQNSLGYPYWYYSHDVDGDKHFTGNIIFSRFPIIDSGLIRYPRPTLPEALMHADIKINQDTIRVYTTHLQSIQLGKSDYERIGEIKNAEDSILLNSKTILSKLKRGFTNRSIQADIINEVLGDSPYPVIFCGDLNDVPNSYTYAKVRGEMQDAFLKKGFGIGRTYNALSPTLRIDYIFADQHFKVRQFTRIIKNYSDHYTLVADLSLKSRRNK
jgi:endonuclease/exonuclease/phosphatase family metal-dependent hydrolase